MLLSEELLRDLGAHLRPKCRGDRLVFRPSGHLLPQRDPLRHLDPEGADLASVNFERRT
jgi:hypothetical protein